MRDIWTNNTWADWLQSKGVARGLYALLEMNGNGLPKKVIATNKVSEELFPLIPMDKRWNISYWDDYGTCMAIGSIHPSLEYLEGRKKKFDKKKKKR